MSDNDLPNSPNDNLISSKDNISNQANRTQSNNFFNNTNGTYQTYQGGLIANTQAPIQNNNPYYTNLSYINNNRNQTYYQGNSNFIPKPKNMKIKWKNVNKIDLDLIKSSNDLSILEAYLENFVYSDITEEEISSIPEQNISKLIKIFQFTIEYLLNSQSRLDENVTILQEQNQKLIYDLQYKESALKENKDLINKLRKERKRDQTVLLTYKNVISNLDKKGGKYTELNLNINKELYNTGAGGLINPNISCKYCTAKIFKNQEDLDKHMKDVHLINQIDVNRKPEPINIGNANVPLISNNNNDYLDKKIDLMQAQFNECLRKMQEDTFRLILENNNKKPDVINTNNKDAIELMNKNFQENLSQIKEMFLMGLKANAPNQRPEMPEVKRDVNKDNEELKSIIKENMSKFQNELINMDKSSEDRANKLEDEIKKLKLQQAEIKNFKSEEITKIHLIEEEKKKIIDKPKMPLIVDKLKDEFIKGEKKENDKLRAVKPPPQVVQIIQSHTFNAGRLETDNDSEEEDKIIKGLKTHADILKDATEFRRPVVDLGKSEYKLKEPQARSQIIHNKKGELDYFYKKYIHRDERYLKEPKLHKYFKPVLPENYQPDLGQTMIGFDNHLRSTVNTFYPVSKNMPAPTMELPQLEVQNKGELLNLLTNMFKNMENANMGQKVSKDYYKSISTALDFKKLMEDKENIYKKTFGKKEKENLKAIPDLLKKSYDTKVSEANIVKVPNLNNQNIDTSISNKKPLEISREKKIPGMISSNNEFEHSSDNLKASQIKPSSIEDEKKILMEYRQNLANTNNNNNVASNYNANDNKQQAQTENEQSIFPNPDKVKVVDVGYKTKPPNQQNQFIKRSGDNNNNNAGYSSMNQQNIASQNLNNQPDNEYTSMKQPIVEQGYTSSKGFKTYPLQNNNNPEQGYSSTVNNLPQNYQKQQDQTGYTNAEQLKEIGYSSSPGLNVNAQKDMGINSYMLNNNNITQPQIGFANTNNISQQDAPYSSKEQGFNTQDNLRKKSVPYNSLEMSGKLNNTQQDAPFNSLAANNMANNNNQTLDAPFNSLAANNKPPVNNSSNVNINNSQDQNLQSSINLQSSQEVNNKTENKSGNAVKKFYGNLTKGLKSKLGDIKEEEEKKDEKVNEVKK